MEKSAVVTGGSRGIGRACVEALAGDGWSVTAGYLQNDAAAESLQAATGCRVCRGDVALEEDVKRLFQVSGPVQGLVCNAGISSFGLFQDITPQQWRRLFSVNVDGVYHCIRHALGPMLQEKKGSIVVMSSMWGQVGASCESAYSATKAALIGLTMALAKELGPSGIRVNAVAPGVIDTEMNGRLGPEALDALAEETPLGRIGKASEVADTVAFLLSDKASYITGQVIAPNGGYVIG